MKINYPDSVTIQQYLEGKLDPKVMHQLEKQALDDPFLSDALEGYSAYASPTTDLSLLQRQLHERIVHMQENKKVFDLSWQRLSVAAAAAVMFVSAGILFWMNSHKPAEQKASQFPNPVEVTVIDRDSVNAIVNSTDEALVASARKPEVSLDKPAIAGNSSHVGQQKKAAVSPSVEDAMSSVQAASSAPEKSARTLATASVASARQAKNNAGTSLNELAITGYNNPPKSGWLAYSKYLESNTRKFKAEPAIQGKVLLSFQVEPDGKLTNIRVLRSLGDLYDKEAIRIVREGSEWTPSSDGKAYENRLEVSFQ